MLAITIISYIYVSTLLVTPSLSPSNPPGILQVLGRLCSVLALLLLVTSSCPGRGLFFTACALLASAFQAALESLNFTDVDVFSGGQILSGSEV